MPTMLDSPCRRTTLALPWLLNGSLPAEERREVRDHLIRCASCRAELGRTREALATFRAAAAEETQRPTAAVASATRFGGRAATVRKVLRPLSWAAMIAAVLAAIGGTWLVGTRSAGPAPAATAAVERPQPPAPATTTVVSSPAPMTSPAPPPAAQVAEASQPRATATAKPSRRATAPAPAPVRSEVISITSFDSGTIAPLANGAIQIAPASSRISTADFENGQLGWQ